MTFRLALPVLLAASIALSGCNNPNAQEQAGTALATGSIAAIGARALGANDAWTVAAGAAGAAAGSLYARNRQANQCAYYTGRTLPNGEPEVQVGPCR